MHYLSDNLWFPNPNSAPSDGLLAVGGDLSVNRLLLAYNSGIFPWFEENQPILWWSPDPRMVLFPNMFKLSKSLRKTLRDGRFKVTFNQNFESVIHNCAQIPRRGQAETWITAEMQHAYLRLHQEGYAISIEVWEDEKLVGGLYGVDFPNRKMFCGESMFSRVSNASKVAFYYLVQYAKTRNYTLIDCQIYNSHLESLGAQEVGREFFLRSLLQ